MSLATPRLRAFAQHLIALEATSHKSSTKEPQKTFLVVDQLRPHLTNLMGHAGFGALQGRALVLSTVEIPWLRLLHIDADGTWEGMEALEAQVSPTELSDARVVVLAQLLGLLAAFVGDALTLRLVSDVWPTLSSKVRFSNFASGASFRYF